MEWIIKKKKEKGQIQEGNGEETKEMRPDWNRQINAPSHYGKKKS